MRLNSSNIAYLYLKITKFDAVDFRKCRSKEVMFLLTLSELVNDGKVTYSCSVHNGIIIRLSCSFLTFNVSSLKKIGLDSNAPCIYLLWLRLGFKKAANILTRCCRQSIIRT